jgi:hypothetical protein
MAPVAVMGYSFSGNSTRASEGTSESNSVSVSLESLSATILMRSLDRQVKVFIVGSINSTDELLDAAN